MGGQMTGNSILKEVCETQFVMFHGHSKYEEGQYRNVSSGILEQEPCQGRAESSTKSKSSAPNTVT